MTSEKTVHILSLSTTDAFTGSKPAETFAVMLTRNQSLTTLNLEDNDLGTKGGAVIAAALAKNKSIRHLNLAVREFPFCFGVIANFSLLKGNNIGPDIGRTVEAVLKVNDSLWSLRLQSSGRCVESSSERLCCFVDNQIGWGIGPICDALLINKSLIMCVFGFALEVQR